MKGKDIKSVRLVHVIPVPRHMTAEEAWAEIRAVGALLTVNQDPKPSWAVIVEETDD